MKILQLAPRLPYPLTDGGAIGIFKPIEAIARLGEEITLVTYPDPDPTVTADGLKVLKSFAHVELVSRPLPSRNSVLLKTLFSGAYPIERRMMKEMFELVTRLIEESSFDIVHIDGAHMGKYGVWIKERYGLPVILREHNFESQIYSRFASNTKSPAARLVANIHSKRLLKEEIRMIACHDEVIPITVEDEAKMRSYVPNGRFSLIPAGVDTSFFSPQPTELEEDTVLWVGGVDWEPNKDAVTFFAKEIFPIIVEQRPGVRFYVVGSGTEKLTTLLDNHLTDRIKLFGKVTDIRPYLASAKVLVCPLRVGGGMRLKLLDFFAAGKAVVSTQIGAEGNIARDGEQILLRDDPQSFASAVITLFEEVALRHLIGKCARTLVEEQYSWDRVARMFVDVYERVLSSK